MKKLLQALANYFVTLSTPYIMTALEPVLDRLIEQAEPAIERKVQGLIERELDAIDVSDKIEAAIRDARLDRQVELAFGEYDIPRMISDAIDDERIESQVETEIENVIERWDFDRTTREKLNEAVRQELKKIFTEQLVS